MCAVTSEGIIDILTVTAYVLTPIVAIIGFQSWKTEKQYEIEKHYAENILDNINEIRSYLHMYYHQVNAYNSTKSADNKLDNYENIDFLQKHYLISFKFRTLQKFIKVPLSENFLERFENETLSFSTAISVARKDELPFPPQKKIVVRVSNASKLSVSDRCVTLPEYKLYFDKAYDELTSELIKTIKQLN